MAAPQYKKQGEMVRLTRWMDWTIFFGFTLGAVAISTLFIYVLVTLYLSSN